MLLSTCCTRWTGTLCGACLTIVEVLLTAVRHPLVLLPLVPECWCCCLQSEQKEAWEKVISGADVVVADEAHEIKKSTSQVTQAMRKIHTRRRLALTGYPLQNKLGGH